MNDLVDSDFGFNEPGLRRAIEALGEQLAQTGGAPLEHRLPAELPEAGIGAEAALEALAPVVVGGAARLGDPGFLAHMDPPTPWLSWATSLWCAALNQNLLHPDTSPLARDLERRVVDWLAPCFGMGGGHLVPGSSVANLTALWAARELRSINEVVASDAGHLSLRKAAAMLGLRYRAVPVDDRQRLRPDELGDLSSAALVLTAGSVAAGAIDPLDAGSAAAWLHVDAAWGGPLRLSNRHARLLAGIERADSVSLSGHKWLFQPKECALVLFRDVAPAHAAISFGGGYLAVPNIGVLGSHGASAAAGLLATLLAWGRAGTAERIDRCMAIADELGRLVSAEHELELFAPPVTAVVLWRHRRHDAARVLQSLEGAIVSTTTLAGGAWLRSVAANPCARPELVVERVLAATRALT